MIQTHDPAKVSPVHDRAAEAMPSGGEFRITTLVNGEHLVFEFADSGGAELAAEVGALSADHLMAVSPAGIEALALAGVTAVLLPGTCFFLMKTNYAPARKLIAAGVPVALGTDCNPGSSHTESMPMVIVLAVAFFAK